MTVLPPLPWTGGCQCGQLRYQLDEAPLTLYACHCTECQKQSASMHGLSLLVRFNALRINGELAKWTRPTDSGNTTDCHFCPRCGTRLYHRGTHRREENAVVSVKGGSLDIARLLEPVGHIWLASRQAGFRHDPRTLQYDRQPDGYDELIRAFAARYPEIAALTPGRKTGSGQ